jgi:uncharacterized protein (TIGR02246 family)
MTPTRPEEVHRLISRAFEAGDVDAYLDLCDPDATVIPQPDQVLKGSEAIRDALTPLLAMRPKMPIQTTKVFEAGDTAPVL